MNQSPADFTLRIKLLEESIDSNGAYLNAYLISLTNNRHDAEEIFDDLWLHVLHRFDEDHIGNLSLLRFKARQLFIDWYRKKRRLGERETTVAEMPEGTAPQHQFSEPASEAEEADFRKEFFSEYRVELNEDQKEALWLHARFGYTFTEIAKIMNRPSSTVGDWIKQARIAFADYLNDC